MTPCEIQIGGGPDPLEKTLLRDEEGHRTLTLCDGRIMLAWDENKQSLIIFQGPVVTRVYFDWHQETRFVLTKTPDANLRATIIDGFSAIYLKS